LKGDKDMGRYCEVCGVIVEGKKKYCDICLKMRIRASQIRFRSNLKNKEKQKQYYHDWYIKDTTTRNSRLDEDMKRLKSITNKKMRANNLVFLALKKGILIKSQTCENCMTKSDLHGHHEDYEKPYHVHWLCARCHSLLHRGHIKLKKIHSRLLLPTSDQKQTASIPLAGKRICLRHVPLLLHEALQVEAVMQQISLERLIINILIDAISIKRR
jgi:hypothetical protein